MDKVDRFFIITNRGKLQWYREDTIHYIQYVQLGTRWIKISKQIKIIKLIINQALGDRVFNM